MFATADFKQIAGTGDQWEHTPESEPRFGLRYARLGPIVGGLNLGTSYCEVSVPNHLSWSE